MVSIKLLGLVSVKLPYQGVQQGAGDVRKTVPVSIKCPSPRAPLSSQGIRDILRVPEALPHLRQPPRLNGDGCHCSVKSKLTQVPKVLTLTLSIEGCRSLTYWRLRRNPSNPKGDGQTLWGALPSGWLSQNRFKETVAGPG